MEWRVVMTPKTVQRFTKGLKVLYVEDDVGIRESTTELFKQFFELVDVAEDGKQGLETYTNYYKENGKFYDFVITDINMPFMNGIEMITEINKQNRKQTIIITSAHDDAVYLIPLIELGVDSFILKPFKMTSLLNVFFKNSQQVMDRRFATETFTKMKIKYKQLKDAFVELKEENIILEVQCQELLKSEDSTREELADVADKVKDAHSEASVTAVIDDSGYFSKDDDEGEDNILLLEEHSQDLLDLFDEISEKVVNGSNESESATDTIITNLFSAACICEFYSPYLDTLATSLKDLSESIYRNRGKFVEILVSELDSVSGLFDAVYHDMKGYAERFKVESMAMKNIHHIHEPTALSLKQIILIIAPEEVEAGEMEFF